MTKTPAARYVSIPLLVIGTLVMSFDLSFIIEHMSPTLAAAQHPGSWSVPNIVSPLVIGLLMIMVGIAMFRAQRKPEVSMLQGVLRQNLYVYDGSTRDWPTTSSEVWIDSRGIGVGDSMQPAISWTDVQSTKWRSLYFTRDAYQINTTQSTYLFSYTDIASARTQEALYASSSAFGTGVQSVAAAGLSISNMKDIKWLSTLHVYARAFAKQPSTFWNNKFEELFFKFMFAVLIMISLLMVQYSLGAVIIDSYKQHAGITMAVIPCVMTAYFVYLSFKDSMFLRRQLKNRA